MLPPGRSLDQCEQSNTSVVILIIFGLPRFVAPYVGSEPVRVEADVSAKVQKQDKHKRNIETFWSGPIPVSGISFDREEWEFLHRDNPTLLQGDAGRAWQEPTRTSR
jgi:hypothetical protein